MKKLFTLLLIGLLGNFSLSAQNAIEGGITNKAGEGLTEVSITWENTEDAYLNKTIQTDEFGYFMMDDLADGTYRLVVTNATHKTISMDNFEFPRDANLILGLTMESLNETDTAIVRSTPDNNTNIAKVYKQ